MTNMVISVISLIFLLRDLINIVSETALSSVGAFDERRVRLKQETVRIHSI